MSAPVRPWRGVQGAAALGVLVVLAVVRGRLLADSYFNQDDFYMTGRAYRADLTWDYLFADFAGHVNPLQQLTLWLVAHHAPFDWAVVVTVILAANLAATALVWLILSRLLGAGWTRVVLLAVFAWAPITLAPTLWWSASMFLWPQVLCSLTAIWLLIRWRQGDGRTWVNTLGIIAAVAVGLLWHERAVLIVPLLLGVAVAIADEATGWRRLVAALRRYWWLWLALVALLGGFLAGHAALTDVVGGGGTARQQLDVSWSFVGQNVVPGLVGGPWAGHVQGGAVVPATWVTVASGVLVVAVIGLLLWLGGPARRWGVAVLVGYVAADLALLLSGRSAFGDIIGLDPRYSSDTLHAVVVCIALCLRGAAPVPALASGKRRALVVGTSLAAYGVVAALGTALLVPAFQNTADRAFVTHFRDALADDPDQVVFDGAAPAELVLPLVDGDNRYSVIFGPLPERPAFDGPSARMRVVASDGSLRPAELVGPVTSRPGPSRSCGYPVSADPATVMLRAPVSGRLLLRIDYYSGSESTVTVTSGGWHEEFLARRGPNEVWLVLPDLDDDVQVLDLVGDGRATVCVTGVAAGLPVTP
ncbi:hypothetical protein F0U44_14520 [Nocardioides humilatus]|uniref:DUF2079 domain-containing protein n=1 Tax=Nocardioides humilatus TaxID=2607660 RepID=A0A5B1LDI7_9ACTN|nr:hypothetical protein [Nocardioides humilatus]KAA1417860.1 hypothetical protein F0U44_14520 [Nocardioides humilatus]